MLKLNYPELLFERTKVYKVSDSEATSNWKDFTPKSAKILLVFEQKSTQLSEATQQMLTKLVTACGFSAHEKLLINSADKKIVLSDIQNLIQPQMVLVFGEVKLGGNITSLPLNYPLSIGQVVFIKTHELEKLTADDKGKAALWKGIKEGLNLIK